MTLDLGCGFACRSGAIGVDRFRPSDAKVIGDVRRLPFKSHSVDEIYISNVLEHFRKPELVLDEIHRVLGLVGKLHIRVPHFTSPAAYSNPEHRYFPGLQTLRLWAIEPELPRWKWLLYDYRGCLDASVSKRQWILVSSKLEFHWIWRWLGVQWIANIYPEMWEAFATWWFSARSIVAVLRPLEVRDAYR